MHVYAFDTLAFAKKLKGSGYTDAQAEALAEAQMEVFRQMLESTLATKDDLRDLATKADIQQVKADIQRLEAATKADIQQVKADVQRLEHKLVTEAQRLDMKIEVTVQNAVKDMKIWFGGMLVLAIGVMTTLMKVL